MDAQLKRALIAALYIRSGGKCESCGFPIKDGPWHMHHRQLRSRGGPDTEENLLAVHPECHDRIHRNPAHAGEVGQMVHEWENPGDIPTRLWNERTL